MKSKISKKEAKEKIDRFFGRIDWTTEELKKIKRLAMKHRIRLRDERKQFCKKCLRPLSGETRVTRFYKRVICKYCGYPNKFRTTQRS